MSDDAKPRAAFTTDNPVLTPIFRDLDEAERIMEGGNDPGLWREVARRALCAGAAIDGEELGLLAEPWATNPRSFLVRRLRGR